MLLDKLFNPKSIAIVGASEDEKKVGNVIARNILTLGYSGQVFLVNHTHTELMGRKCYASLADISETVDLAIMAIPSQFVAAEIEKNAGKIKNYVIISAGYSEVGEEGKKREEELKMICEKYELNILGPNCLGFIIPSLKLNASFAGGMPESGNISFVSQSGALAVAMMDVAKKENIKFSSVISIGNKVDITEAEVMEHFCGDAATKVIGMYLEGIKDGRKFVEVSKKMTCQKPIVVIKAGKTERAQRAIASHTGALAGSEEIMSAVCAKLGIMKAHDLEEFFDLVDLISNVNPPATPEVAVVTNAGGPGVLTTDAFLGKTISLREFDGKTKEKLKKILPAESSVENPIDLLGDAQEDRYDKILKVIGKDESVGSVVCVLTPQDQTPVNKIARKIINFKKKSDKTIVTVFIGGDRVKKAIKKMEENGIPNYSFPDRAVKVLDDYYRWSMAKTRVLSVESEEKKEHTQRKEKITAIIQNAKNEERKALYFSEAKEVMEMYGINCVASYEVNPKAKPWESSQGLALGEIFPVVLKVDSDKILHKTDKKGVILDIKNEEELGRVTREMQESFPGVRLIVQPMLPRKTELILGIKKDPVFGPIIVYGLGGIYTEILKMVDFLIPPLTPKEIEKSLLSGKISFLFRQTRGQAPYDAKELANILWGLSHFAQEITEIAEFDINPLLIYNDGSEALAVDVKVII